MYQIKKRRLVAFVITFLFSLLCVQSSFAKSPVFKVSKGSDYLYLGGTIHLLSPNDYPLPSGFQEAFNDAEHVYFETDIDAVTSPEVQAKMASFATLPEGQSLKGILNEDTYSQLEEFLAERQIPVAAFDRLTPAAASLGLAVLELQRLGLGNPASGVDQFYSLKTKDAEKTALYLESIDEQIGFLNEFNKADPNLVIQSSIESSEDLSANWEKGLKAWRAGDLETLGDSLGADDMRADFPDIYRVLVTDRNNRWLVEIKEMFDSKEVELLLVGALHLADDIGLVEQLREEGYKVEQLD